MYPTYRPDIDGPKPISQDQKLSLDPNVFNNRKRYDIFISFHGLETLENIKYENGEMNTRTFVHEYLINAIQSKWKSEGYIGMPAIFYDNDVIHGNIENAVFEGISALQVLYDGNLILHFQNVSRIVIRVDKFIDIANQGLQLTFFNAVRFFSLAFYQALRES